MNDPKPVTLFHLSDIHFGLEDREALADPRAEARRLGYDPDKPAPDDGTYRWKNKRTGEVLRVPNGIDPG